MIDEIVGRRNARNGKRLDLERSALQSLPAHRTTDYEETIVIVTSTSGFILKRFNGSSRTRRRKQRFWQWAWGDPMRDKSE